MANSTINFNPARFAGGVAKSFVSATTQVISSYMPFTSELLSDASDTVFNVKEFVAENRPDRNIRGGPTLLKSFANKSLLASKTLLSDLSRGDLSFETSRNQLGNYLSRYKKDEFDFGFDTDDLDFEFDDEDYDNSEGLEGKQFTVEDFAEGIYESTSATIGAIETSSKNIALMNAKSNSVLGDRLIANNMVNMNQTMQMFEVVNKNISGVNNNLASLVEYNNTTMNSFIENTMTHFNKVESFMDLMAKRFAKQDEERKQEERSTKIFDNGRVNFGNLFTKGINMADKEFFGGMGMTQVIAKTLGGLRYGDKMPKWLEELITPMDLGEMIKNDMANPLTMILEAALPEFNKLSRIDIAGKTFLRSIKKKLTSGSAFGGSFGNSRIGKFLNKLFGSENEEDPFKTLNTYKNKEATWTTSDSIVLQNIIPSGINEINNNLADIGAHVQNIVYLMELNAEKLTHMDQSLLNFNKDALDYFSDMGPANRKTYYDSRRSAVESDYNRDLGKHKRTLDYYHSTRKTINLTSAARYKKDNALVFNSDTGRMETMEDIAESYFRSKVNAYETGMGSFAEGMISAINKNGRFGSKDEMYDFYGGKQNLDRFNKRLGTFINAVFRENFDYVDKESKVAVNEVLDYNHNIDEKALYLAILKIADGAGVDLQMSKWDGIEVMNRIVELNEERKEAIKRLEDKYYADAKTQDAVRRKQGSKYRIYGAYDSKDILGRALNSRFLNFIEDQTNAFVIGLSLQERTERINELKRRGVDDNDPIMIQAQKDLEEAKAGVERDLEKEMRADAPSKLSDNVINIAIGGFLEPVMNGVTGFVHDFVVHGREAIDEYISNFNTSDFIQSIIDSYETRKAGYQRQIDKETGTEKGYYKANPDEYGMKDFIIGGQVVRTVAATDYSNRTWESFKEMMEKDGYDEDEDHKFYKDDDDGERKYAKDQWIPRYATGATKIDKDKIVQVHEGEMILDKSLSENVRGKIVNMINSGGFDKMSAEDQKALVEAIESSDERYKGQAQKVINMIHTEAQKHDLEKGGFSDQNVCRLDLDPDDSPSIAILKTLSEMSINIRTMLSSFIGEANDEESNGASVKLKGNLASIFGEFDKENKVFKGGLLSKGANNVSDELKYWLFQNFGGFSYTGSARDENGNIIAGETKSYKNGEDNPETIGKQLKGTILKRAEELANEMGLPDDDRRRYIKSLSDLVGGAKGAGKGWVAGLAIKAMLGLSLGPIFGLVGGFALANETTRELILGAETTDEDGNKYRYGGIFSGIINQFTELGRDVKMNFLTTAKEVGDNLRNATTMFIDKFMNRDKPTIIGQILTGVKDAAMTVASTVTDVTVDAAQFGAKFVIGAAKIPFNMAAGLIGGKEYREAIKDKKFDTRNKELQAIYRELAASERLNSTSRLSRANAAFIEGYNGVSLTRQLAHGASKLPGMAADKASKTITDIGETISTTLPKLAESLDTFRKQNSIGLKGLINMVPAAAMLATGNIPAALMFAGFNLTNFLSEKAAGLPIVGMIAHGVTLLKNRISNKLAPVGEFIDNNMHALKLKLGIKDKGFFGRKMRSRTLSKASILSDLGIDEKTQARYYAIRNNHGKLSEEDQELFDSINKMIYSGTSESDMKTLNQLDADDARYKDLVKRESDQVRYDDIRYKLENENGEGVSAEDMEFYKNYDATGLRFGYDEKEWMRRYKKNRGIRSQQRKLINRRKELFKSKYGNDDNIRSILNANADGNFAANQAVTAFRGSASGLLNIDLIKAMYPGISDEDAQSILVREQGIMDENRSKLRGKLLKQFGSITDENLDQVKAMIAADKNLGKDAEQIKGWTLDQTKQFALGNSVMEKALEEGKLKEEEFRNKITGTKDSILSTVTDSAKTMRDIFGFVRDIYKFKTDPEGFREEQARKLVEDINKQGPELSGSPEMVNPSAKYGVANFRYTTSKNANPLSFASYLTNDKDIDVNSDAGVGLVLGGPKVYDGEEMPAHAEGVLNVRKTGPALIHKGEAVLDAESASSFRQGKFGISGAIADTLGSLKSGISDLVTVFKGDKTGSDEDKKSFLDKMKDSFTGVGDKITGAVFGSGLIPLTPLGKPDIAKIGARLIALLGGVLVLGPIISKVAEKLKPIFEPLWEGIKSAVKTGVETIKDVIYDMAGVSSFPELMHKIGAEIHIGWKNIGKYSASQSINKANTEFGKDKTVENTIANRKTIEKNIKASGSDMNFSDYTAFCNTCQRYFEAIIEFGKFVATEASLIQSKRIFGAGTAGGIVGVTASVISYATGISKPQQGIITRAFESQLTSSEKQYINSSVAKNSAKLLGPITGNWFAFESANMMSDFCQVIKSETGVQVTYEDNAFVADTNTSAAKIQRGTEIMNTRIGILNTLRNTGGGSTSYFADQFKSQIAARQNEINAANMTTPTATTSDYSAGQGIGYGYTQNDPRWSNMGYGRFKSGGISTMGSGGCGPTAMSNVYSQLTGRSINPAQMARFSQANGYNAQGGTSAGLFTSGARKLGLTSRAIGKSGSAIGKSVMSGNNVIIAGKNGPYTKSGHIMSVRGVDGFGNAIVDDPLRRGARRIPMNKLTRGMTHAWSIGNGEGVSGDQGYSTWSDIAGQGVVTFNPNGGAFGYNGPKASMGTAHSNMENACIYNSFINGYINAALGNNSFQDYVSANGWSPYSLLANGETTQYDNDDGGVKNYGLLMNDLINKSGLGEINWHIYPDNPAMNEELLSSIKSNLEAGNPMLFSVKNGKNDRPLSKITSSYNNNKVYKSYSQHGVLLAGLQTIGDMQYVLIDNPARTGNNQLYRMPIADFENGVLANDGPYIHRLVVFNRGTATGATGKASLATKTSNAANTFANIYAKNTGDDSILNNYNIPKSSNSSNSTGTASSSIVPENLLVHADHASFGDYLADIIGRLAQFGSNLLGTFVSGKTTGLTASGVKSGGGGQNYSGVTYQSGMLSDNGYLGVVNTARQIVHDAGQISLFLSEVRQFGSEDVNKTITKNVSSNFIISENKYKELTGHSSKYAATVAAMNNSKTYWSNVDSLNKNRSYSHVLVYTWVVALAVSNNITYNHGDNKIDASKNDAYAETMASRYYGKIANLTFTLGTPHNDYYIIDNSVKDPKIMGEIPGGVGGGNTLSTTDIAKVHQYMMDIITTNETGANKSDPDYINKAYFTPHWLSGENNITMGRIGFYDSNAAKIFSTAMNHRDVPEAAKNTLSYLYTNVKSRSLSPSDVTSTLNMHPEVKPYIIAAEDAMTNEFTWDYIKRALGQYQSRGMQDPRSIILGAEFAGVSPASVPSFYSSVTNPGASDELDQVRQGMFNTIAGFRNYSKYEKGWKNRINGMYDALTSSDGYNPHTGKYYPVPAEVAALIPNASIGNGDAGYNMRDNYHMYSDDVYMGDADHPMNVTMDNTPVTSRLDKLVDLLDYAVNYKEEPKAGPTNAISLGNGTGEKPKKVQKQPSNKGTTNIGQSDKLANIHSRIARRTRVGANYNHM